MEPRAHSSGAAPFPFGGQTNEFRPYVGRCGFQSGKISGRVLGELCQALAMAFG